MIPRASTHDPIARDPCGFRASSISAPGTTGYHQEPFRNHPARRAPAHSPSAYARRRGGPRMAERRLAAIMFTDIVGYTALMARDEDAGHRARDRDEVVVRPLRWHAIERLVLLRS